MQAAPVWAVLALDSSFLIVLSVLGSSQPLEHVSMLSYKQKAKTEMEKEHGSLRQAHPR